jgi:hypothetical protein
MSDGDIRVTLNVAKVLRVFLDRLPAPQYGYDLMKVTGSLPGSCTRFSRACWLQDG